MNKINYIKAFFAALLALFIAGLLAFVPAQTVNAYSRNIITDEDPVPLDVRLACDFWGQHYNVCPELLEAIAFYESSFDASAENYTCKGLMQINESVHGERMQALNVDNICNLECNVMIAADYLAELFEKYEDVGVVLGKYHGEKDAQERAEDGNLSQYVIKILEKSAEYERAHGK